MKFYIRFVFLVSLIIFFHEKAAAQKRQVAPVQGKDFLKVDSLADIAQPKAALALTNNLNRRARAEKNTPMLVKSVIYRLLFQRYLDRHGINETLSQLKQDIKLAAQPEKSVFQSLLAQLYWDYYQQNSYRINGRTTILQDKGDDIATWSANRLTTEAAGAYLFSLKEKSILQQTKLGVFNDLLAGDKATRFLRPTLYDLLAHRALDAFLDTRIELTDFNTQDQTVSNDPLWFAGYKDFVSAKIPVTDSSGVYIHALSVFQELLKFHVREKNAAALADVNLKRLKFVYQRNTTAEKDERYLQALQQMEQEVRETIVYTDVIYEHALLYQSHVISSTAAAYSIDYSNDEYNDNAYGDVAGEPGQSIYHPSDAQQDQVRSGHWKGGLPEAITLADKAIAAYPGSTGAINSGKLISQIKHPTLFVALKQFNVPEKPLQVMFSYNNIDTVYTQIYRIPAAGTHAEFIFDKKDDYESFINTHKLVQVVTIALPSAKDYLEHKLLANLDGLPSGNYLLVVRSKKDTADSDLICKYASFKVSAMAVTTRTMDNTSHQYFVSSSADGKPLKDVKVEEQGPITEGVLLTNAAGFATSFKSAPNSALITRATDSLYVEMDPHPSNYRNQGSRVVLFTDRPIYRPGQTVFYKGLFLKYEDDKNTIIPGQSIEVNFMDVNRRDIAKTTLTTNVYGTFQGSFEIPAGKLNGEMQISTAHGSISIGVEEYKRPNFEVLFDQDQQYKLNDTVNVHGKAISYAGYAVAGAKVKYTVMRYILPNSARPYQHMNSIRIASGTTETLNGGSFKIRFFTNGTKNKSDNYSFQVKADITDINGETRSSMHMISLGSRALQLNVTMPEQVFLTAATDTVSFTVTDGNGAKVRGKLEAQWTALRWPGRIVHKSPYHSRPEYYTLNREDYIKAFPYEEYKDDVDPQFWSAGTKGPKDSIALDGFSGNLRINPSAMVPGFYKVQFSSTNLTGDTLVATRIVRIYPAGPATIQNMAEWLVTEKSTISRAESAVFRIAGALPEGGAWYEVYYKGNIIETVRLKTSPQQQIIRIKARPEFTGQFAVQFTMVQNGRVYNVLKTIIIADPADQLQVKFLTFRKKLQPGEKESWKLRITNQNGEKQMAEMVATLYDASLDQLRPVNWDKVQPPVYDYSGYIFTYQFNNQKSANTLWYLPQRTVYHNVVTRKYERLDVAEPMIFGGFLSYNDYLLRAAGRIRQSSSAEANKRLSLLAGGNVLYGVIKDQQGFGIPGVAVRAGKLAVQTDKYGIYQVMAKAGDQVQVSYIGYRPYTTKVTALQRLDIVLEEDTQHLNEQVVVGYGSQYKKAITVRGSSSVAYDLQGAVAGVQISAIKDYAFISVETYDPKTGHMIIDGKDVQTVRKIEPRNNFMETAFFYPQLHTSEAGEINIDFTIPQSLTRYKMKGFVHTKDMKTTLVSRELITQKQLVISVNAPRFFREGDTISLSAKLNNLSGQLLKGDAVLELKDALTGKNIDLSANSGKAIQHFSVAHAGNDALKWNLIIPSGLSAVTYTITAQSGDYSDGEEMTVPVLPNKMLVTETMLLNIRANTSKVFSFDQLLKAASSKTLRHQGLTVEFTSNPAWYALQALPYLMESTNQSVEQIFNRFYANSFAAGIIKSSAKIKQVFDQWKSTPDSAALLSNLEKNPELKSALLEETPWVQEAASESERKRRLAVLFDLNRMGYESKDIFEQLRKMQNENGSYSWFTGMPADRYMTQYIVQGLAQLKRLNLINERLILPFDHPVEDLMYRSVAYLDKLLIADYKQENSLNRKGITVGTIGIASARYSSAASLPLHYLYARSYLDKKSSDAEFNVAQTYYLKKIAAGWKTMDVYQQGQAALILYRYGNKTEAMKVISLLKQRAKQNEEMGMYWPDNQSGWYWYQSPLETQSLLIEAFDEIAGDIKAVEEMKIWLLKNKQTTNWKTTKATAAACYALLRKGTDLLAVSAEPEIRLGGKTFTEMGIAEIKKEAGTGYYKVNLAANQVQPALGTVSVQNPNTTMAWGAVYWQYFEQLDQIKQAATGIRIKKELYLQQQNGKGETMKLITPATVLAAGDLVRVKIEIYADRDMDYVHLKDMRAAGFEPVNVLSRYKYQDGLGYYESTKDASSNFFIGYLRKGVYVFEYDLRVSHAGNFSNGITTLQSMYAPEFTTHSAGERVTVER